VALLLLQQFTLILLLQQQLCKAMQKLTGMPYSKGTDSQPPKRELTKVIYACDREGKDRSISSKLKDPTIHEKRKRPGSRLSLGLAETTTALARIFGHWDWQIIKWLYLKWVVTWEMPDQHLIRGYRIRALLRKASVVVVSASPRDKHTNAVPDGMLISRFYCSANLIQLRSCRFLTLIPFFVVG
jgi:hypothetical protein